MIKPLHITHLKQLQSCVQNSVELDFPRFLVNYITGYEQHEPMSYSITPVTLVSQLYVNICLPMWKKTPLILILQKAKLI